MADLAIIVRSSYNSHLLQSKSVQKINFSGFIVKAVESHFAWFCSLLQMSWAAKKSATIHFNRPLVFAPMICLFLLCILIRIVYSEEHNRYNQPLTTSQYMRRSLILSVRCILSAPNYMTKIKIPSAQKLGAYRNECLRFFCCPSGLQ